MKSIKSKKILSFFCFVLVFFLIYGNVDYILRNKSSMENISTFYEEPRNSVDVILAGTSHAVFGFDPMEMYNSEGIVSYNMAQGGQWFPLTYYCIEEALRLQNPKVVVCDLYYIIKDTKCGPVARSHSTIDNMKWSPVKLKAILDAERPEYRNELIFPIIAYHSRYDQLGKNDFIYHTNVNKGCTLSYQIKNIAEPSISTTNEITELSEYSEHYLRKLINLCNDKNVQLLFTVIPYSVGNTADSLSGEQHLMMYNRAFEIADQFDIPYINFMDKLDEIGINFESDYYDTSHINFIGAKKISNYLASYLKANYSIPDRRDDPEYQKWNDDLVEYQSIKLENKKKFIQSCKNLSGYIGAFKDEKDFIVTMSIGGHSSKGITDPMQKELNSLGIKTDLKKSEGSAWLCVLDNGEVVYEETSINDIIHTNIYSDVEIELHSSPNNKAITIINSEIQKTLAKGLVITVYSKSENRVIDSVRFNIASTLIPADRFE